MECEGNGGYVAGECGGGGGMKGSESGNIFACVAGKGRGKVWCLVVHSDGVFFLFFGILQEWRLGHLSKMRSSSLGTMYTHAFSGLALHSVVVILSVHVADASKSRA